MVGLDLVVSRNKVNVILSFFMGNPKVDPLIPENSYSGFGFRV